MLFDNTDRSPPSILTLLEIHRICPEVFDRMEVYLDGGIRRGTDILKALCLGATAVSIGRPFLYSLVYGEEGAVQLVKSESATSYVGCIVC
jgi:L-lactate dehydrogenase (cytochrome)